MFDQESYKHYEIATIRFKHAFALSSLVEAELDGSPVTLAAETDTTIIFAVWPDVYREGSSTLKFTSDGQSYSLVVNVIAAPSVADPETIFSSYQDQISQSITFIEELKPVDTGGIFQDQDVIAAIDSSKAILASLGDEWNALSPEQKLAVTNLLQANSSELNVVNAELQLLTEHVFSTDLGITLKSTGIICQTGSGLERYQCVAGTIGKLLFQTVKYTGKAYLAALTIPIFAKPFPVLAGFPIAVSGFLSAKAILSGLNALILTKQFLKFHVRAVVFHVFDVDINNLKTTGTPIEFVKNKPKAMPVYIKLRRVLDNDVNSSTPWLSNFVSTIHQYNSFCDKYPTAFGKYKVKMPLPHQKDFSLFRLSDISVKNITNTKIKAAKITGTL